MIYNFLTSKFWNFLFLNISAFLCIFLMLVVWFSSDSNIPNKALILISFVAGMFGGLVLAFISQWITNIIIKRHDSHIEVNNK